MAFVPFLMRTHRLREIVDIISLGHCLRYFRILTLVNLIKVKLAWIVFFYRFYVTLTLIVGSPLMTWWIKGL